MRPPRDPFLPRPGEGDREEGLLSKGERVSLPTEPCGCKDGERPRPGMAGDAGRDPACDSDLARIRFRLCATLPISIKLRGDFYSFQNGGTHCAED